MSQQTSMTEIVRAIEVLAKRLDDLEQEVRNIREPQEDWTGLIDEIDREANSNKSS